MSRYFITLVSKKGYQIIEDEDLVYNDGRFYANWRMFENGLHLDMEEWRVLVKGEESPQEYFDDMVERLKNGMIVATEN